MDGVCSITKTHAALEAGRPHNNINSGFLDIMEIVKSQCEKIEISNLEGLDPITVMLEDLGPRQGRITIRCWNDVWMSYWGGMGDRSISEFFCSCDEHYLAKNLSDISSSIHDLDGLPKHARRHIGKLRATREISKSEARTLLLGLLDFLDDPLSGEDLYNHHHDKLHDVYGDDWWAFIPKKTNPKYAYLCRIINTVKEALRKSKV